LPLYMLREYPVVWDGRKARLFWCACLRRGWDQLTDDRTRRLVEEVELHAEEDFDWFFRKLRFAFEGYLDTFRELGSATCRDFWAFSAFHGAPPDGLMSLVGWLADSAAQSAARAAPDPDAVFAAHERAEAAEKEWQCDLIREVFGNPFRTVDVSPWLTSDVVALARGIYEEKAFDRMPILADALQDAGCDNVNVLDHCREPREHVRGCWVVDLLLGKG
jgi:hypothetical protein